jgi:hypothetical protein
LDLLHLDFLDYPEFLETLEVQLDLLHLDFLDYPEFLEILEVQWVL